MDFLMTKNHFHWWSKTLPWAETFPTSWAGFPPIPGPLMLSSQPANDMMVTPPQPSKLTGNLDDEFILDIMNCHDMCFLTCVPNLSSLASIEVCREPSVPEVILGGCWWFHTGYLDDGVILDIMDIQDMWLFTCVPKGMTSHSIKQPKTVFCELLTFLWLEMFISDIIHNYSSSCYTISNTQKIGHQK